jgi:hypothetical protein
VKLRASRATVCLGIVGALLLSPLSVKGVQADPDTRGGVEGDTVFVAAVEQTQKDATAPGASPVSDGEQEHIFTEYRWVVVCVSPNSPTEAAIETDCNAARVCAQPNERLYRLWGRAEATDTWVPLSTRCFGAAPTDADTPRPQITPALVLNEIRRIGLPTLRTHTQPEDKTLVNFDTIFYTQPRPFTATVTLLGQQVDITAEPTSYTWHHGDGTSATTRTPGAPYPSQEVTHRYTNAHTTVRPRLDVTYAARFRVNDGTWQTIDETVTITGPETALRITEATPVLSGDYS